MNLSHKVAGRVKPTFQSTSAPRAYEPVGAEQLPECDKCFNPHRPPGADEPGFAVDLDLALVVS